MDDREANDTDRLQTDSSQGAIKDENYRPVKHQHTHIQGANVHNEEVVADRPVVWIPGGVCDSINIERAARYAC